MSVGVMIEDTDVEDVQDENVQFMPSMLRTA